MLKVQTVVSYKKSHLLINFKITFQLALWKINPIQSDNWKYFDPIFYLFIHNTGNATRKIILKFINGSDHLCGVVSGPQMLYVPIWSVLIVGLQAKAFTKICGITRKLVGSVWISKMKDTKISKIVKKGKMISSLVQQVKIPSGSNDACKQLDTFGLLSELGETLSIP